MLILNGRDPCRGIRARALSLADFELWYPPGGGHVVTLSLADFEHGWRPIRVVKRLLLLVLLILNPYPRSSSKKYSLSLADFELARWIIHRFRAHVTLSLADFERERQSISSSTSSS